MVCARSPAQRHTAVASGLQTVLFEFSFVPGFLAAERRGGSTSNEVGQRSLNIKKASSPVVKCDN